LNCRQATTQYRAESGSDRVKTQCEGVLSINGGTQYGAVGGSQWMLALKLEPLFCVPNPRKAKALYWLKLSAGIHWLPPTAPH